MRPAHSWPTTWPTCCSPSRCVWLHTCVSHKLFQTTRQQRVWPSLASGRLLQALATPCAGMPLRRHSMRVCTAASCILTICAPTQLARAFIASAAQGALCDDDAGVRTAAGGVFNVLFKSGGGSAMDSVIPALLSGLDSEAHSAQVGDWGACMAGQARGCWFACFNVAVLPPRLAARPQPRTRCHPPPLHFLRRMLPPTATPLPRFCTKALLYVSFPPPSRRWRACEWCWACGRSC